jgi:hypothetical protein
MITYIKGDATQPIDIVEGNKIIPHICNNIGGWGAGFVLALSKRWPQPEQRYKAAWQSGKAELGSTHLVRVEDDIWVANMVAQRGIRGPKNPKPIQYRALKKTLRMVAHHARSLKATVHMPLLGAGLSGGDWDVIEDIVEQTLCRQGIVVYAYIFPNSPPPVSFDSTSKKVFEETELKTIFDTPLA